MTSNLGSEIFGQSGLDDTRRAEMVRDVLQRHFRPEFINRIDDIIVFHALTREHIGQIIDVQLRRLEKRLEAKRIKLELDAAAKNLLAEHGYDPAYGARPLKRAIQRLLLDPLTMEILEGRVHEGATVRVSAENGAITLHERAKAA
jgi:ATP-dependent Clp protease ATP-binding subunit ClpB